jgi:hypothetical protein
MADDDFDIDIYGDAPIELETSFKKEDDGNMKVDETTHGVSDETPSTATIDKDTHDEYEDGNIEVGQGVEQQRIESTSGATQDVVSIPKQLPQQQGVKRKEGSDERPVDPGATTALLISDLHWWNTDDDIRGWVNQAQCEDELKDITFSEHKINGKSKGYVV